MFGDYRPRRIGDTQVPRYRTGGGEMVREFRMIAALLLLAFLGASSAVAGVPKVVVVEDFGTTW